MKRLLVFPICMLLCSIGTAWSQNQPDFYDTKTIQAISITFKENNWRDILDSLRYNGEGLLNGTVEINKQKFEKAGIRYRSARGFQIGGKHNSLYVQLPDGKNYQGYAALELSNAVRDPSVVREVLASEIARKYMPAPKANYAKVLINGNYYGFFVNIESVSGKFLTDNFGGSNGDLYRATISTTQALPDGCKKDAFASLQYEDNQACYTYSYDRVNKNTWNSLIELTDQLNNGSDNIDNILNIDQTLWMLAFNNVIVNLNSYTGFPSQNYFLYKDAQGQFHPVLGDLNFAFGSYKRVDAGSDWELKQMIQMDPLLHLKNAEKPLISKLLSNEAYRKIYLSHMRTILEENFSKEGYEKRAKELQALIQKSWTEDPNKEYNVTDFGQSLISTVGKRSRIPGLTEFMSQRTDFLRQQTDLAVLPPEITNVKVLPREKYAQATVESFKIQAKAVQFAKNVRVFYRFASDQLFKEAIMQDNGGSNDEKPEDEIFGVEIRPAAGVRTIEFYIMAENAKALSFDPPRYMYERHKASLDDLNK